MRKIFVLAASLLFCGLMAAEGRAADYDALYPLGTQMAEIKDVAPSLPDLNGKTICELWNYRFRGDETFPLIREMLKNTYPAAEVIPYTEFGKIYGPDEPKAVAALPEKFAAFGCDAVISGNGG